MTYLLQRLDRWLPRPAAALALVMIYATTLVSVALCLGMKPPDLVYLDVRGAR